MSARKLLMDNPYESPPLNGPPASSRGDRSRVTMRCVVLAMMGFIVAWFWIGEHLAMEAYRRKGLPVEQLDSCVPAMVNFATYAGIIGIFALAFPNWLTLSLFTAVFAIHFLPYLAAIW